MRHHVRDPAGDPKGRARCCFARGFEEVRGNLEMKNMVDVVQRAARKTRTEADGARTAPSRAAAHTRADHATWARRSATELERQRLGEEKDRAERERADLARAGRRRFWRRRRCGWHQDHRRLERERQMLQQNLPFPPSRPSLPPRRRLQRGPTHAVREHRRRCGRRGGSTSSRGSPTRRRWRTWWRSRAVRAAVKAEYFENQWRAQADEMRPPRKVPEDYPPP